MAGLTFAEVLELGDIVVVRDAWCPEHGRSRPEALAFPFTADRAVFKATEPSCPICGEALRLDAETAEEPLAQHLETWSDELGDRISIRLRPLVPGSWHLGVTSLQPDRPSGLAPNV